MKFKLIQLATLLAFVMSVMYLAQAPDGFSHSGAQHDPIFKIDEKGKSVGNETGDDPRWKSFSEITSGTNGSNGVSARGWAYRPGILNGGTSSMHDPADNTLVNAKQTIYTITLTGSASASSSNASASLIPGLGDLSAHPVPKPSPSLTSYYGNGRINLNIPELLIHLPQYYETFYNTYYSCRELTAREHKFRMDNYARIYIDVRVHTTSKRDKQSLTLTPTTEYGSVSYGYESSSTNSYNTLRTEAFGIQAKIGNKWWGGSTGINLQGKTAEARGDIGNAQFTINAAYSRTRDTWCPGTPSIGEKKEVPHGNPE